MSNTRLVTLISIIGLAALARLLPNPSNVTPMAAVALFGGALFASQRLAFLVPLVAMFVSDVVLGFHSQMLVVYLCFLATVAIGRALATRRNALPVTAAAMGSSLLFFVVTNFSVWVEGVLYPRTAQGLASCFVAALPFFQQSLTGDLFYTVVLFGGFALLERWLPALQKPQTA